jgi:elongation factor 1 alpha-like protein
MCWLSDTFFQNSVGSVLCDPEQPIPTTKKIKAQILTFTLDIPLMRGHRVMLHYQNMNEPARLVQLLGILDKNAEIKTKKPRFVFVPRSSVNCIVTIDGNQIQ